MRGWKLEELIDFEVALGDWDGVVRPGEAIPPDSRSAAFKAWLGRWDRPGIGKSWLSSLGWAAGVVGLVAFLAGFGAAWGSYDARHEGVNVLVFLAVTLLLPWVFFAAGVILWSANRRRVGVLAGLVKRLAARFAGAKGRDVLERIDGNPDLSRALGWRIAARTQGIAADYHFGAFAGLLAMFWFRKTGFFWESTTERATQRVLESVTDFLALPMAGWGASIVPEVEATRRGAGWEGGGAEWGFFLMMALVLWGCFPRWALALVAGWNEWRALREPAFEAPRHRKLWRSLTGVRRGEDPAGPADGALVIDLGGVKVDRDFLRPFFLRRLRLNPVAWETTGVLDSGREAAAADALAKAPAGVVLLAEGWSLAPRQAEEILRRMHDKASGRRVVLYVADFDGEGRPRAAAPSEREAWASFADGLAGVELELVFHEEDRTWAPG